MAAGDSSQRTEKPTAKRLREGREKGQIAKSPDLSAWAGMLVATVLIQGTARRGSRVFPDMLHEMGDVMGKADMQKSVQFAGDCFIKAAGVVAPLLIGLMFVAIIVNLGQVGLKPSAK